MKFVGLIGKIAIGVVIISFLTVYTTATIVGIYVDRIMKQFNIPVQLPNISISAVVDQMLFGPSKAAIGDSGAGGTGKEPGAGSNTNNAVQGAAESEQSPGKERQQSETPGQIGGGNANGTGANTTEEGNGSLPGASTTPPFGIGGPPGPAVQSGTDSSVDGGANTGDHTAADESNPVIMTADEFMQKKEKLSDQDKSTIFSLLVTKLPQDDLQQILSYVENGITQQELDEVNQIVEKNLSTDEYEKLLDIISKY